VPDNGSEPPDQPPHAPASGPPWVALGLPLDWDPNLPVRYAFARIPGLYSGSLPVFAMVVRFAGQQLAFPFNSADLNMMVKRIREAYSGLILPG
jgi:hypothetical protein